MSEIMEARSIATASTMATAAAWWQWKNLDKQTIARRLALRLMAYAAGVDARDKAVAEAMAKEIVLR